MDVLTNQWANNNNQQRGERQIERADRGRVPRGVNRHVAADNSSSEEEHVIDEETEIRNQHHNSDYRVKAEIPLFYGTMGVEEFMDWQIDVDRFFDVMSVPENRQV